MESSINTDILKTFGLEFSKNLVHQVRFREPAFRFHKKIDVRNIVNAVLVIASFVSFVGKTSGTPDF